MPGTRCATARCRSSPRTPRRWWHEPPYAVDCDRAHPRRRVPDGVRPGARHRAGRRGRRTGPGRSHRQPLQQPATAPARLELAGDRHRLPGRDDGDPAADPGRREVPDRRRSLCLEAAERRCRRLYRARAATARDRDGADPAPGRRPHRAVGSVARPRGVGPPPGCPSRCGKEHGEWRIAAAPNALLVPRTFYEQTFQDAALYFFDPTGRILRARGRAHAAGSAAHHRAGPGPACSARAPRSPTSSGRSCPPA